MRKIGIFTAYQPHVKLGQEGIGRLLLYIVKGMLENGDQVTIIAPSWHRKEVKNLLKEHLLEKTVKVRSMRNHAPILLLIYDLLYRWKNRSRKIRRWGILQSLQNICTSVVYSALSSYSFILFTVQMLILLVVLIPLLPLFVIYCIIKALSGSKIMRKAADTLLSGRLKQYVRFVPRNLRSDALTLGILNTMRTYELKKMVRFANKSNIDLWYIPSLFWPETLDIRKKRALVAPDLVYADFPQLFSQDIVMNWSCRTIDKILQSQPKLVCYSHYVARRQLSELRDVPLRNITVIPHGVIDLSEYLGSGLPANEIIDIYLRNPVCAIPNYDYVKSLHFEQMDYLIYTSQYRYHKNITGLLNCFARLLREELMNLKLILTCSNYDDLMELVEKLNLTREVIFMPHVPEHVLAALNAMARLHVNPSLFEGAFPFTFGEAYSAGTPSVMADIPVTREIVTDESLRKIMLFDPCNEDAMVERIKWALAHRKELLDLQKPLFEHLKQRSWAQVAAEYVSAMRNFGNDDKLRHRRKAWKHKHS